MANDTPHDERVNLIKKRLEDNMVDDQGHAVNPDDVARVVDAAAAPLADAPIQEFTPLLIEHAAEDALREQGFHPDLGDEDDDAQLTHEARDDDQSRAIHLSTQQGLAMPDPD